MVYILPLVHLSYLAGGNMKKKIEILRMQPVYLILVSLTVFCAFILLIFVPNMANWRTDIWRIIWYIVSIAGALFWLFQFLKNMQFVIIKNGNIVIKSYIWITIAKIVPEKIIYITMESLPVQSNPGSPVLDWITIYINEKPKLKIKTYGANDFKGGFSWRIIASKHNLEVIRHNDIFKGFRI